MLTLSDESSRLSKGVVDRSQSCRMDEADSKKTSVASVATSAQSICGHISSVKCEPLISLSGRRSNKDLWYLISTKKCVHICVPFLAVLPGPCR